MNSPIDQFLEQFAFRHPVDATLVGVRLHDHELPDWTREARDDEQDEFEALTIAFDDSLPAPSDPAELAGDAELLDGELARMSFDVRQLVFESRFFHDRNPALWTSEALWGVLSLMLQPPLPLEDALASVAMRLHEVPRFLGDLPTTITEPMPAPWHEQARREAMAAQELLRSGLATWLDAHAADDASRTWVLNAGRVAADAFATVVTWLDGQRADEAEAPAIGGEAFAILLTRGHACDTEVEALQARLEDALASGMARLESMELEHGADALTTDSGETNDAARLIAAADRWDACRDLVSDHDLVAWFAPRPHWDVTPPWARQLLQVLGQPAFRPGVALPPDASPVVHLTPASDASSPSFTDEDALLVVREHALGRATLLAHADRSRCKVGRTAGLAGARMHGVLQGRSMAEGWSQYALDMADEVGFFTASEQVLLQRHRVRTALCALLDVQLHTGQTRFDDAVERLADEGQLTRQEAHQALLEVSMYPTSALATWLGVTGIRDLREAVQAKEGSTFSWRGFHDELLQRGAIPVLLAARLLLGAE